MSACHAREGLPPCIGDRCSHCPECGNHSFAAADGRCLYCHREPVGLTMRADGLAKATKARKPKGGAEPVASPLGGLLAPKPDEVVCVTCGTVQAHGQACEACSSTALTTPPTVTMTKHGGVLEVAANRDPFDALDEFLDAFDEPLPTAHVEFPGDPARVAEDRPGIVGGSSPSTSRAAADLPTGQARIGVLLALARRRVDGRTAEELEADLGKSGNTIRPRLLELERDGFVRRSDDLTRPTRSGAQAVVWLATARGVSAADRLSGRPDGMP